MPELDRNKLNEEFNLEKIENQPLEPFPYNEDEDPDVIIRNNIERANRILDTVEDELLNGNFSARLVEVASKMIDSVSTAVSQIQSTAYNEDYLQLRGRMVELKEREIDHKVKQVSSGQSVRNQNIIFTDRESVLKALRSNKEKKGEEDE